jgi:mono/diheme cytochrome c family protein
MKRTAFFFTLALLAACSKDERAAGQFPIGKDELAAPSELPGAATYRRYCVACHGVDGRGNGGITGKDFVADKLALAARNDAELASSVRDGKRGERGVMPAHKPVLSDAQISEVVGYVRQRFLVDSAAPR